MSRKSQKQGFQPIPLQPRGTQFQHPDTLPTVGLFSPEFLISQRQVLETQTGFFNSVTLSWTGGWPQCLPYPLFLTTWKCMGVWKRRIPSSLAFISTSPSLSASRSQSTTSWSSPSCSASLRLLIPIAQEQTRYPKNCHNG